MLGKRVWILAVVLLLTAATGTAAALSDKEKLGKYVFFDEKMSVNQNQACAACHGPQVGYTGPEPMTNVLGTVYEGSVAGRFGNRKPPASAYAGDSPVLHYNTSLSSWAGGMFWDGRATGQMMGDPLAEQAKGPFLNPLEQALPDAACVVYQVATSNYKHLYKTAWDDGIFTIKWPKDIKAVCSQENVMVKLSPKDRTKVDMAYDNIARSIAAYERSKEVSSFTSKYDDYLKGKAKLTQQEKMGLDLFEGKAKCGNCHAQPLFTDYTYDNIGIPKNPLNPFYYESLWNENWESFNKDGLNWVDYGLGGYLKSAGSAQDVYQKEMGKFKVPTLRNVDKRPDPSFIKAFGHNGYFKSLELIVHFYNTRDTLPRCNPQLALPPQPGVNCWPAPEVSENMNTNEVGNLQLTSDEEEAIVAFLKTLSDRDNCKDNECRTENKNH